MGSAWAAAAKAGVLVLRQRLKKKQNNFDGTSYETRVKPGKGDGGSAQGHHP